MAFPVIDISAINEPQAQLSIAKEITEAARTWGFLLLKNHPIPSDDIASMFAMGRDFFINVPEDEKAPYPINDRYVVRKSRSPTEINTADRADI